MVKSEHFGIQRKVVAHMVTESWKHIPHVSYLYEPDITDFYAEYQTLAQAYGKRGRKLSLNTALLKVIAEGLKAAPSLNAHIAYRPNSAAGTLRIHSDINISMPWLLPDGRMITPVIPRVESLCLSGLADAVQALGEQIARTDIDALLYRAALRDTVDALKRLHLGVLLRLSGFRLPRGQQDGKKLPAPGREGLSERNLTLGTVTVSNVGSLYRGQAGFLGLLEIIPPQVFAVGIGAVQDKPGVYVGRNGHKQIGIRSCLPMCLAFDHRAVDFNALVPFLQKLDGIFAHPAVIRSW